MPRLSDSAWKVAKEKYVTTPGVTYEQLADELGVARMTVIRHARKDDWQAARKAYVARMSLESNKRIAELSETRAQAEAEKVDKSLRLVETYQAGLSGIIYQCLLRLGIVRDPRNEREAELVRRAPQLWDAMDAKELNRILQKAIDGQLDLMKQKALITGNPTGRVEVIGKPNQEAIVIERTPEEQQEFERVITRIRETAEEAGLVLPEG